MQLDPKSPAGGGCLIFAGFLLGAFLGIAYNEPSIGVLMGTGIGVVLALALWLIGRRETR